MKLILNQDVHNLGEEGDVVVVKRGYGRNYLLPQGLAVPFNRQNQALFASRAEIIEKRKEEKRQAAASLKDRIDEMTITILVSAGESGRLFGSVTNTMVQEALAKEGIEVEKKRIEVPSHAIKMVGEYKINVRLYEGENAVLSIDVTSEAILKKREADKLAAEEAAAKAAAKEAAAEKAAVEEVVVEEESVVEEEVAEENEE
ncbi:MAG: 50S ribosomal protein L9 [Sphaerochaetaceae bacterium]|jgi:large subunit ribosomal protein L9|nr:50S ribosomal protein L9 [Sphaerochaetaceae bacterium]HHU88313.1 50S ribosomal protein L9 [Spirochaetales bacterium]